MKNPMLNPIWVAILALPTLAFGTEKMRLDLLQGTQELTVQRAGATIKLKAGDSLLPKDELSTGPKESARIAFPDGSQLWVGGAATVQVNSAIAEGGHKIQLIQMKEGAGRILVPKTDGTTKRIKLVVKTHAATMGVRGTDFVVDAKDSGKDIELHTLEGSVDAAKSVRNLIEKDAVPVGHGFTIHALDAKPIPQPKSFDVKVFTNELNRREPAFTTYAVTPLKQTDQSTPQAPQQEVPTTPAPGTTQSTSPGLKGKIENMMQQHQNSLDQQIGH